MGRIRSGRRMKKKRRKEGRLDTVHERNTLLKSCYIEKSNGSKVNQIQTRLAMWEIEEKLR